MNIFNLPDLGEGLAEAKIQEWHVKEGDFIKAEQLLVSVETAKAVVDVPAPFSGIIEKLFGKAGDNIETGHPLIGFKEEGTAKPSNIKVETIKLPEDQGTVVGAIEKSDERLTTTSIDKTADSLRITPVARALAKKWRININNLASPGQLITPELVKQARENLGIKAEDNKQTSKIQPSSDEEIIDLNPMRHSMFDHMNLSKKVVAVSIFDEADINRWYGQDDITVRIILGIVAACKSEPILNASLDDEKLQYQLNQNLNLGLAIDTAQGLYVPVIKDVQTKSAQEIRETINEFKHQALNRQIRANDLHGATISLSNYGMISGRFANSIIVPPQVAIIGAGQCKPKVVAMEGTVAIHWMLPISLSFDHRLVTGAEAARFLAVLLQHLQQPKCRTSN